MVLAYKKKKQTKKQQRKEKKNGTFASGEMLESVFAKPFFVNKVQLHFVKFVKG